MKSIKLLIIAAILCAAPLHAATAYKVVNGKVAVVKADTTEAKKDKLYQVINGTKFYQGAKGGIYYYRTSKKTGKPYKCYVKSTNLASK